MFLSDSCLINNDLCLMKEGHCLKNVHRCTFSCKLIYLLIDHRSHSIGITYPLCPQTYSNNFLSAAQASYWHARMHARTQALTHTHTHTHYDGLSLFNDLHNYWLPEKKTCSAQYLNSSISGAASSYLCDSVFIKTHSDSLLEWLRSALEIMPFIKTHHFKKRSFSFNINEFIVRRF